MVDVSAKQASSLGESYLLTPSRPPQSPESFAEWVFRMEAEPEMDVALRSASTTGTMGQPRRALAQAMLQMSYRQLRRSCGQGHKSWNTIIHSQAIPAHRAACFESNLDKQKGPKERLEENVRQGRKLCPGVAYQEGIWQRCSWMRTLRN